MSEVIQIGPLTVNTGVLVLVMGILLGVWLVHMKMREHQEQRKVVIDIVGSAIAIGVIAWKLSPFLLNPTLLWTQPMVTLLSISSGIPWVGLLAVGVYGVIRFRKDRELLPIVLDTLPFWGGALLLVDNLVFVEYGKPTSLPWGISLAQGKVLYHPINVYVVLLVLGSIVYAWRRPFGSGKVFSETLMIWGIGLFVISFFQLFVPATFGLTGAQWEYLVLLLLGIGLDFWFKKQEGSVK